MRCSIIRQKENYLSVFHSDFHTDPAAAVQLHKSDSKLRTKFGNDFAVHSLHHDLQPPLVALVCRYATLNSFKCDAIIPADGTKQRRLAIHDSVVQHLYLQLLPALATAYHHSTVQAFRDDLLIKFLIELGSIKRSSFCRMSIQRP